MRQTAAYDSYAGWYEEFRDPRSEYGQRVSDVIRDLLGPGRGTCLDVCCGGGACAAQVSELGWTPLGVDLSAGQLRYAASRLPAVQADAAALPLPDRSMDAAICVLAHTDQPDYAAALREMARVLRPGGRFVHVGVHPCFVGVHADRRDLQQVKIYERYASRARSFDGWMPEGVVVRVGAWHLPLAPLLNAVLDAGFRVVRTVETGPAIPGEFSLLALKPSGIWLLLSCTACGVVFPACSGLPGLGPAAHRAPCGPGQAVLPVRRVMARVAVCRG